MTDKPAQDRSIAISSQLMLTLGAAMALAPGYLMITGSLKTQADFLASPWSLPTNISFAGYQNALTDQFPRWFLNTIIVAGLSVALTGLLAATAAWGFVNWKWRGRETILGLLVSLMVVPPVVLLIPLFQLGAKIGLISTYQLLIAVYVGLTLPFSIYLLANFFRTIPVSLLEAAQIDGASPLRSFVSVVLPLSGPPIITVVVVNMLWAWNELLLALVFMQQDDLKTLMIGITGFQSRYSLDIPTVMAGLTIATTPLVLVYIFGQRYFMAGLTAGAVKGE
ncbi:MAG: carbohydrate ABC transporter permease [Actinobacteria bacterium]|nr:carbohydrate ABC transporter permease [Actinomycetota bacterium]